mmetsp:Transcript_129210/g.401878  ORF Transcript_129210/g.401878 Transcript_129210/m.401878 type:complete len:208 (+) Transcript_129210:665-1288(+)
MLRPILFELHQAGHAGDEHGRLAEPRLLELRVRTLEAQLQDVPAQDLLGLGEHGDHLRVVCHVAHHLDVLGALAREEDGDGEKRQACPDPGGGRDDVLLLVPLLGQRTGAVLHRVEAHALGGARAAREEALDGLRAKLPAVVLLGVVGVAERDVVAVGRVLLGLLQDLRAVVPAVVPGVAHRGLAVLRVAAVGHALPDVRVRLRAQE